MMLRRRAAIVWTIFCFALPRGFAGYGVRSIEDSELVEHLREQRIHLELCPSKDRIGKQLVEAYGVTDGIGGSDV